MPRFLHQGDPDLSDLNRAKKQLNRDYAKQYSAQDGLHDNLGQTADKDAIYNALSQRLTGLLTALLDFSQQLNSPVAILNNPIASFRPASVAQLQQLAGRIITEVRAVQTIFGRIKTFNMFTPPEAQTLQQSVQDITDTYGTIIGASQLLGNSPTAQQIDEIIASFSQEFSLLSQFLNGASSNYRALEGRGRMRGGYSFQDAFQSLGDFGRSQKDNVYAFKLADDARIARTGGAIVPAYNGEGVYGSDGYRIGDFYTYSAPRRFY